MTHAERIKYALIAGLNILLWGPPGTGKSRLAFDALTSAWKWPGSSPAIILVPEDCPVAELRGHYVPRGTEWTWQDGPVTSARRTGTPIILDELSHASPEAVTFLHQVTDDTPYFTLPNGDTVQKQDAPIIATMNDVPARLRPALLSRFPVVINVDQPDDSVYAALLYGEHAKSERATTDLRSWVALEKAKHAGLTLDIAAELIFPGRGRELAKAITIKAAK